MPLESSNSISLGLHGPVDGALGVLCGGRSAFVIKLFALADAKLYLHPPALKIKREGDECVSLKLDQIGRASCRERV